MDKFLDNTSIQSFNSAVTITGSKSESNRLLILQQFFPQLQIENLSNADDTLLLQNALNSKESVINIGHAGTAMRFLTAYFATVKGKEVVLTGSARMQQRPIKILVDALKTIGAEIEYLNKEGYPPLKIKGKNLTKNQIKINANVSSQYISALLLIAPSFKNGLSLTLLGNQTSIPYILMTLSLLNQLNIKTTWNKNVITIFPNKELENKHITVESDWSAASYYYSLLAMNLNSTLKLSFFKENSLQGDKALAEIYTHFGIKTAFNEKSIHLGKIEGFQQKNHLQFNLINTPDIAQTIAVTCLGLGISCKLTGLHTLKIKETDRLEALKTELQKFGAKVKITEDSLHLEPAKQLKIGTENSIKTYNDHRMAMAFAPLSLKCTFKIEHAEVVSKSYPAFWGDFNYVLKNNTI